MRGDPTTRLALKSQPLQQQVTPSQAKSGGAKSHVGPREGKGEGESEGEGDVRVGVKSSQANAKSTLYGVGAGEGEGAGAGVCEGER